VSNFRCPRCSFRYPDDGQVYLWPLVGGGWSWSLYKCPECRCLFACEKPGGFVPLEVLIDPEIEVVEFKDLVGGPGTH